MDDKYDDLIKLSKDIMQVSYKEINGLREQVRAIKRHSTILQLQLKN
jgi:hypothetical protein